MIQTFYRCDLCAKLNEEDEEFKNEVLLITAETAEAKSIPVKDWVKYKLLIYTPSIVAGVSFTIPHLIC